MRFAPRGGAGHEHVRRRQRVPLMIVPSIHPGPGDEALRTRLVDLVGSFGRPRIVVVGDLIADEFIYGRIDRVSREAPVLILKYDATEVRPGGAGERGPQRGRPRRRGPARGARRAGRRRPPARPELSPRHRDDRPGAAAGVSNPDEDAHSRGGGFTRPGSRWCASIATGRPSPGRPGRRWRRPRRGGGGKRCGGGVRLRHRVDHAAVRRRPQAPPAAAEAGSGGYRCCSTRGTRCSITAA